jgi:plastocyanin domain-containing protein
MLGAFVMLDKAYGSQPMQVTVAHGTSRKAAEARTGTKWMGLEPTLDQTSNAADTCFDDDEVLHTPVHTSRTVTTHTPKRCIQEIDAGLVNM